MQARNPAASCLAMSVALACAAPDVPAPRPTSVEPGTGYGGTPTPVVIHGTDFAVRTMQPSSGGSPTLDTRYRAWLGEAELIEVAWVDSRTLRATVPAGLPAGAATLVVEGPFGRRGSLDQAFVVSWLPGTALRATAAATPSTASVGQGVHLDLTVANDGTTDAVEVTPEPLAPSSADGAAAVLLDGPSPPSVASLRPGQAATFAWTWQATAPGSLSFDVRASGRDVFSGQTVAVVPPAPARTTVQRAAALSATLGVPATVQADSDFAVTMAVANSGEAAALAVSPSALAVESGSAAVVAKLGPSPPLADVPGGGSVTFVWIYGAGPTSGAVQLSGEATGRDANSGAAVGTGRVISTPVTVGRGGLVADLAVSPAAVAVGLPISLALRLVNPGNVAVTDIAPAVPTVSGTGAATLSAGPTPASIASLGPSEVGTFTWSYTASAAGQLGFAASASGTDGASGASVSATASLAQAVTIQGAAALGVSAFTAAPNPAVANQPIALSLTLANGGTSPASVTAVTPTVAPAGASCTAVTPAPPATIAAGGTLRLAWTCTAAAAGSYTLGATVQASDPASGADLSPAVPGLPVTVLGSALLTAAFTATPNPAAVNQAVAISLALGNGGSAPASVTGVSLQVSPPKMTCTAVAPAPPQVIAAGGALAFGWTCSSATARGYNLAATVTASDAISGADISPTVPGISLTVGN